MREPIDRDSVQELIQQGAQLVEALPVEEYEYETCRARSTCR
jgi:hypothetical protein